MSKDTEQQKKFKLKLKREFGIGALTIIVLILFYVSIRILKGINIFSLGRKKYYAIFDKGGLKSGDTILINGLPVGNVDRVTFIKEGFKARVDFSIRKDIELDSKTTALLSSGGIFSGRNYVKLIFDDKKGTKLKPGSRIRSKIEVGVTEEIVENTIPVLNDIKATSAIIGEITAGLAKNTYKINAAITNLELMTYTLKNYLVKNKDVLNQITSNINQITTQFANKKNGLGALITNLNSTVKKVGTIDVKSINTTIKNVHSSMKSIQKKSGLVGKLIHDNELYTNLNNAILNLNRLLINLREKPSRYVRFSLFGGRSPGRRN